MMAKTAAANSVNSAPAPQNKYADLKELKELLDNGIITQADFDAKKAEILK